MGKTINADLKSLKISDFQDKSLLILDDDDPFRSRLARAMEKKGFPLDDAVGGGGGGSGGGGGDPTTASSSSAGQHKRDWNCDTAYVRMSTELYLHAF